MGGTSRASQLPMSLPQFTAARCYQFCLADEDGPWQGCLGGRGRPRHGIRRATVQYSVFRPAVERRQPGLALVAALLALLLAVAGCSSTGTSSAPVGDRGGAGQITAPAPIGGAYGRGHASGDTEAGAAFARWVLERDPERRYLTDAVVRGEQVLGIKVQPTVTKRELRELLPALAEGMARTFPGRPLVVNAYDQSGEQVAEGVVDPRTHRVDVQFV